MTCLIIFLVLIKYLISLNREQKIEEQLVDAEHTPTFCKLDFLITKDEVSKYLHALKNGKSSGLDNIPNEMLK